MIYGHSGPLQSPNEVNWIVYMFIKYPEPAATGADICHQVYLSKFTQTLENFLRERQCPLEFLVHFAYCCVTGAALYVCLYLIMRRPEIVFFTYWRKGHTITIITSRVIATMFIPKHGRFVFY